MSKRNGTARAHLRETIRSYNARAPEDGGKIKSDKSKDFDGSDDEDFISPESMDIIKKVASEIKYTTNDHDSMMYYLNTQAECKVHAIDIPSENSFQIHKNLVAILSDKKELSEIIPLELLKSDKSNKRKLVKISHTTVATLHDEKTMDDINADLERAETLENKTKHLDPRDIQFDDDSDIDEVIDDDSDGGDYQEQHYYNDSDNEGGDNFDREAVY